VKKKTRSRIGGWRGEDVAKNTPDAIRNLQYHPWSSNDSEYMNEYGDAKSVRHAADPELKGHRRVRMGNRCMGKPDGTRGGFSKLQPTLHAESPPFRSIQVDSDITFRRQKLPPIS
jgi:hypothetical protein